MGRCRRVEREVEQQKGEKWRSRRGTSDEQVEGRRARRDTGVAYSSKRPSVLHHPLPPLLPRPTLLLPESYTTPPTSHYHYLSPITTPDPHHYPFLPPPAPLHYLNTTTTTTSTATPA
ncbi:hypothetical protein Pmani_040191 [Petrolisthes manimaculis]|uniref:Uncharacterized protein n=1 Tax=Petrolisthes manimaculis TaxID=1843537 RepID=A0AAE1NB54_9EUCA|nr:hypothetical protein Pmani_040191 [Petrolisthes manimaculis]